MSLSLSLKHRLSQPGQARGTRDAPVGEAGSGERAHDFRWASHTTDILTQCFNDILMVGPCSHSWTTSVTNDQCGSSTLTEPSAPSIARAGSGTTASGCAGVFASFLGC